MITIALSHEFACPHCRDAMRKLAMSRPSATVRMTASPSGEIHQARVVEIDDWELTRYGWVKHTSP